MTKKTIKLSFRKQPAETGLASVVYTKQSVDIKINGKVVGVIYAPTAHTKDNKWSIAFQVYKDAPDDNPNSEWKWIFLKARFDSEIDARVFVRDHIEEIMRRYMLYEAE